MKVVDMHCDTISELLHIREQWEHDTMLENHLQIDLNKMQKGDYLLQNFAMFVHLGREQDPFYAAMKLIDLFYTELEPYSDRIGIVKSWKADYKAVNCGSLCQRTAKKKRLGDLAVCLRLSCDSVYSLRGCKADSDSCSDTCDNCCCSTDCD